jgi:L-asparaginase II
VSVTVGSRVHVEVPDNDFSGVVPLVAVMRGEYVGSLHLGCFAVCDSDGTVQIAAGDPAQRVFLRSSAKPFQAMPAVLSGAVERFGLTECETAVICASHHAEPRQMEAVRSALARAGLGESSLRCGVHPPIDPETAADFIQRGEAPTQVCNNCSGAHTGMLLACVANGWPLDTYGDPNHPLQVETRQIISEYAGVPLQDVQLATDNCAVPTFRLPLAAAARAFARLATGDGVRDGLRQAAETLTRAMTGCPGMVSGYGGFDTEVMTAASGDIVSKGGAEGFLGLGWRNGGLGLALKIADGNARAVPCAAVQILDALGALSSRGLSAVDPFRAPEMLNPSGQVVGCVKPVFSVERGS